MMTTLCCWLLALAQVLFSPPSLKAMTIGEEREIGEKLLLSVRAEFDLMDDPDISQYINSLGQEVLALVGPVNFKYHFFVVKSDQFNAFAAPAGLVFFYTGLIEQMKSEDELISVLAHEIGHVVSRHIASRIDKGGKVSAASIALGLAGLALGVPALSQALLTGSLAAGTAINLEYSRQDEEEADRRGFEWMKAMHRDPDAMEDMLRTMRRITRYSSGQVPQYLLTHPNPEARMDYVQSLIELDQTKGDAAVRPKADNFNFLRFKYRIMLQTADREQLRTLCSSNIAAATDKEQQIMGHYGMALIDGDEHNFDRALHHLAKVEEQYADRDILTVDHAVLLRDAGRIEEAASLLRQALHRDSTSSYAAFELAKNLQLQGQLGEAEKLLKRVAADMPEFSRVYFELGRISSQTGRDNVSQFYLAKYYLYEGKVKPAREYFERAADDATLPEEERNEAVAILAKLRKMDKE